MHTDTDLRHMVSKTFAATATKLGTTTRTDLVRLIVPWNVREGCSGVGTNEDRAPANREPVVCTWVAVSNCLEKVRVI